jgi:hypothetical protein
MPDYAVGDSALYRGKEVSVIDDTIYLPLARYIKWFENGRWEYRWVKIYELEEINHE